MRKIGILALLSLALLVIVLTACEANYTSQQDLKGGKLEVQIGKANGATTQNIEVAVDGVNTLEADVTLSVEKGSYKIELIGKNDQVTLELEASDGQSVSGHGWMAVDSFGDATYRITATEAEDVEYTIEYVFY